MLSPGLTRGLSKLSPYKEKDGAVVREVNRGGCGKN